VETSGGAAGGGGGSGMPGGVIGDAAILGGNGTGGAIVDGNSGPTLAGAAFFDFSCGSNGQLPASDVCASCQRLVCVAELAALFGEGWQSGSATGPGSEWFDCIQSCSCGDQACYGGCEPSLSVTPECTSAVSALLACVQASCGEFCAAGGSS
jgi:hypothetical protein